ncbi:glycoside hydrolase family 30 beta sandwich domain-containing protein [Asaia sp. As-1742]|uniref:glycoside hydrolase family 30 protein n=1 Tax=Asaia sp. As-1742 TaxID=2608325 RepID=UPI0014218EEA|nr:glycoside hydrolase family 30 beta sandwich domain-containing protein [Asaia sp. As-1742]NIE81756.1 beta-glycosidase [Asaia sp. As-1742]
MSTIGRRDIVVGGASLVAASSIRLHEASAHDTSTTPLTETQTLGTFGRVQWVATTPSALWVKKGDATILNRPVVGHDADITLRVRNTYQTIKGFGACFSELGWNALTKATPDDRKAAFHQLFSPGVGANLSICRAPIGANDFAVDWYSYDETSNDFWMEHFSIERDKRAIIPFIHSAQAENPHLQLWASPWSPPTWMKYNHHYATSLSLPGWPQNGLKPDQVGIEGKDLFIQEARYFSAYAMYFEKYVLAYREAGIPIFAIMPQNEFNSKGPYPSCCWTPEGLARLVTYLYPRLEPLNVKIYFGTFERPYENLFERFVDNLHVGNMVAGVGMQWAGKGAIAALHHEHPDLDLIQSEAECGDGRNDWRYCRYIWRLMLHFFNNGVSVYDYWNIALENDAASTWGWKQNSLITVNSSSGAITYNYEYYLLKHFSHFIRPDAVRFEAISWTGYDNALAFLNKDRTVVLILHNDMSSPMPVRIRLSDEQVLQAELPSDSFNTFVLSHE